MAKKTAIKKKEKSVSPNAGLVFTGSMFIGLGLDFFLKTMPAGIMIGMGVGFILMFILGNKR